LLPFSRIAPFVEANAGFLYFNRNVPSDAGSRFNFQFGGGVGLEYSLPHRRMIAAEYRVHHISNAYTAPDNSGIDQQMLRVSYVFGR
jgi:lipid A 3-O-deacylase